MIGFTPGPWTIRPHGKRPRAIFGATNAEPLAAIFSDGHNESKHANARLIAAAPDLLKVAINLLDAVVTQCDYGKGSATDQWVIEAKDAIKKATTNAHDRA